MFDFATPIFPWLILGFGILVTLLVSIIRVDAKRPTQIFALLTLVLTFISAWSTLNDPPVVFASCMEVSSFTRLFLCLFSALGAFFILGFSRYLTKESLHFSDYYHLLLILIFGDREL